MRSVYVYSESIVKVFISHQQADSSLAVQLSRRLTSRHGIDSYIDVIDRNVPGRGEDLAEHVKAEIDKCTQLLAVVSEMTKTSWWVPWEIGIATEKDYPLATYAGGAATLPDYLLKWPYLRSESDLDQYAIASKAANEVFAVEKRAHAVGTARGRSTAAFYRILRASLRQ
jgi:hypothetical protein